MTRQPESSRDQERGRDGSLRARGGCWSPQAIQGGVPVFQKGQRRKETLRMPEQPRTGAHAFRRRGGLRARRAGPRERTPRDVRQAAGTRAACRGALGPARSPRRGTAGSQFPSPRAPRFLGAPPPGTKRKKRAGGGGARPSSVPNWLLQLSIQNLFLMGGVPPSLPQITFATSSQPVGPHSAGHKRLGASELGPTVSRPGLPRPDPRHYILPYPAIPPSPWKRSSGLAVTQRRNVASRGSRLDARFGWGCGGSRGGPRRTAEEKE